MAIVWAWVLAVLVVCVGGAWLVETVRNGQRHRHEQRMEQLRAEERRLRRLEGAKRTPEPVCGCGHHLAKHDRRGHCHETVQNPTGWDADRTPLGFSPGQCNCQRYVGPQPLSQIYADDLTDDLTDGPTDGLSDEPLAAPGGERSQRGDEDGDGDGNEDGGGDGTGPEKS